MAAALLIARSRLRANLTATVVLVLLAGVGGGIVMASIAGIRRADASWGQLQVENPTGDALVAFVGPDGNAANTADDDLEAEFEFVQALDEVEVASRATATVGVLTAQDGSTPFPVAANVFIDADHPALVGHPVVVDGSLPDPTAADEVAVDELMADRLGVEVGDRAPFAPFLFDELESASDGRDVDPGGRSTAVLITAIVRQPGDLLPPRTDQYALYADEPYLLLTPGWWEANGPDVGNYGIFVIVDLRPGAAFADLEAAVAERFGDSAFVLQGVDEVGVPEEVRRAVDRQIGAEGRAVAAFAFVVALAAVGLLAIALARQLSVESADRTELRAVGLTTRALVFVNLLRSLVIALGAGLVAVVVAVGLSAWLPFGVGRRTLREPGLDADWLVLAVGLVVVALIVMALVALVGWRVSPRASSGGDRLSLADRVARAGASPSATVGVRMAFDAAPADAGWRTAVAMVALAVAVVVAAAGIVGSLSDLRASGARLGQVWDASAGNFASPEGLAAGTAAIREIEGIDAVAGEMSLVASVGDRSVSAMAYLPVIGALEPTVLEGRAVEQPHEAIVGPILARTLGLGVGDELPIAFSFSDEPERLEVVGIGPVAAMGGDIDPGQSVLVHPDIAGRDQDSGVSVLLVRLSEEADREATLAELREAFPSTVLVAPVPSRSVQTMAGLTVLPVALAAAVSVLALAAAANGAVASVRRRRRDLAILKVLGMHRVQVRRVVRWQALTWALLALAIGLPLGVLLATVGWREAVRSLGLDSPLTVPVSAMAVSVVAAPGALLALTWWPARRAAETRPAVTLRSE